MLALLLVAAGARAVAASGLSIEVGPDQRVTISGRSDSLKTVLDDVCFRAEVDLLFFDADDRAFGGNYRDMPLKEFLARALARDSYIIESSPSGESGTERLTTLRVLGSPGVASARRAKPVVVSRHWQLPPTLLKTAFGSNAKDSAERDAAVATIAARISGNPAELKGFLATDARLMAQAVRRYAGIEVPLRDLQKRYPDPRIAGKIEEILAALAAPASN